LIEAAFHLVVVDDGLVQQLDVLREFLTIR
jgi:hypothetical protein